MSGQVMAAWMMRTPMGPAMSPAADNMAGMRARKGAPAGKGT